VLFLSPIGLSSTRIKTYSNLLASSGITPPLFRCLCDVSLFRKLCSRKRFSPSPRSTALWERGVCAHRSSPCHPSLYSGMLSLSMTDSTSRFWGRINPRVARNWRKRFRSCSLRQNQAALVEWHSPWAEFMTDAARPFHHMAIWRRPRVRKTVSQLDIVLPDSPHLYPAA